MIKILGSGSLSSVSAQVPFKRATILLFCLLVLLLLGADVFLYVVRLGGRVKVDANTVTNPFDRRCAPPEFLRSSSIRIKDIARKVALSGDSGRTQAIADRSRTIGTRYHRRWRHHHARQAQDDDTATSAQPKTVAHVEEADVHAAFVPADQPASSDTSQSSSAGTAQGDQSSQ